MTTLGMILLISMGLAALFTSTLLTAICIHNLKPKSAFIAQTRTTFQERDLETAITDDQIEIPSVAYSIMPAASVTLLFVSILNHAQETTAKLRIWKNQ